ncbi:hypothetical protein KKE78_01570 [Patescibacteria group bacterium]|nr:hypothetical protein [Patescibacteria group bacterium]
MVNRDKKIIKVLSIIGVVLIFGGLGLLIFLEIKFLNMPNSELVAFSETIRLPSSLISSLSSLTMPSQSLPTPVPAPTATPPPTSGSTVVDPVVNPVTAASVSPYRGKFTGVLADNIKLIFADPSYKDIISLIDDSVKQTDPNIIYTDYKKAFNLMKTAYLSSQDTYMLMAMMDIRVTASTLPQFSVADMEIPE